MPANHPSRNPVERLFEIAIVIVTLSVTVYLLGWALWLWWLESRSPYRWRWRAAHRCGSDSSGWLGRIRLLG